MINFIKGNLIAKQAEYIVIETGGIGYEIIVPANSPLYLNNIGDDVHVFTHFAVREDNMSLYGFNDEEGRKIFRMLLGVNGVGAKGAIAIVGAMTINELKASIVSEDVAMITRANGIGKKTAQRIIIDLKEKIEKLGVVGMAKTDDVSPLSVTGSLSAKKEAVEALCNLGIPKNIATTNVDKISGKIEDATVEIYIKEALKRL